MRYILELTGTSPLLMHNIRLADEDDEFVVEIKRLTGKRKKTKDDRDEIGRLEWYGGLYADGGTVVFPTANVKRCVEEIGKVRRLGRQIVRAVIPLDGMHVPLAYDGPRDIDKLWGLPAYRHRVSVGVSGKRVTRVRPQFPVWSLSVGVELLTDVVDADAFVELVHLAGRAEGLGDGRKLGYGRFSATVKEA